MLLLYPNEGQCEFSFHEIRPPGGETASPTRVKLARPGGEGRVEMRPSAIQNYLTPNCQPEWASCQYWYVRTGVLSSSLSLQ